MITSQKLGYHLENTVVFIAGNFYITTTKTDL